MSGIQELVQSKDANKVGDLLVGTRCQLLPVSRRALFGHFRIANINRDRTEHRNKGAPVCVRGKGHKLLLT
jgi:hypothetical protein